MNKMQPGPKKWTGLIWRVGLVISVLILYSTAMTLAAVGNRHAGRVGTCVNSILGTRNGPQTSELDAEIIAIGSVKTWVLTLDNALKASHTAQAQERGLEFIASSNGLKIAATQAVATLEAVRAYRAAHPLGRC